ncbi:MAG: HAMP domain-containing histidine kinase [Bdellovibrionaceae bacterium]|nr:HAMP domain-containing histidine kinase [Pseudobdellovibrionaceae bacterium]
MNYRIMMVLLLFAALISTGYKLTSNRIEEYRHKIISDQVCHVSEARLQVGSTREVVDVAKAALIATGHPEAEITLKVSGQVFTESGLQPENTQNFSCETQGRDDVKMDIFFPKLAFFDVELGLAFVFSLIMLLIIKILFSILLKELQNKFITETDKRLSVILGFSDTEKSKSAAWINWLFKTNPSSIIEFKARLKKLEDKVSKQSKVIKTQAQEKAWDEFQLTQARKFKDLAHQVRHDLRQSLGVIKSAVSTLSSNQSEKGILSGAISSLEFMVDDLKEREYKNVELDSTPLEVLEVVLSEVVSEQRVFLGAGSKVNLSLNLASHELNLVHIQPATLKRVFTNLVRNSIEAINAVGSVAVTVTKLNSDKVLVTIEDTGSGFSEEAMKNLFKKGFTTKQSGSGLGLSFCLEKIREWGGSLYVDPTSNKTRIEIELPLSAKSVSFAHPQILADLNDTIIIDDHPLENDLSRLMKTKPVIIRSLAEFEQMQRQNTIKPQQTLVFDLHLESGRKALEVIEQLPGGTDYLFMTSDYLNSTLLDAAEKGQFLVVPKDLMGNALEHARELTSQTMEPSAAIPCLETSASI